MIAELRSIGDIFGLPGDLTDFETVKNGNINSTYKVTYSSDCGEGVTYIFQRINTYVFKNPRHIMENIERVTSHIKEKCGDKPTLEFYKTSAGENYTMTDSGFWRVMNYIDSFTVDTCDDPLVIEYTGEAFGQFQLQLADLDGGLLYETIPNFHNTRARLEALFETATADVMKRRARVEDELSYIRSVFDTACLLWDKYSAGEFPVRVTHNDTKSNNVLFDKKTKKPLCVIDLDTVMPGMAMYDFGDAVRSICNKAAEDEPDLSKVSFDEEKFKAFCRGYMRRVKDALTPAEIEDLVPGAFSITVELASRFLADYLDGDKYFRIDYPEHNLVRARCQLCLAKDISSKSEKLNDILRESIE